MKRENSIAVPSVILFFMLLIGYVFLFWANYYSILNFWIITLIGAFLAYGMFTVIHEACHENISLGNSSFRVAENIIGWVGGVFLFFPYSAFKRIHLEHHAHTNDPQKDPDSYVNGSNAWSAFLRCSTIIGHYYSHSLGKHSLINMAMKRTRLSSGLFLFSLLVLIVVIASLGYFPQFWNVVMLPAIVAAPFLAFTFDWLPHYPHHNLNPYQNTRIVTIPGLEFLSFFQSYHLIHHLYPRIPFYQYKKKFQAIEDELIREKSPIEGFRDGDNKLLNPDNTYSDLIEGNSWKFVLEIEKIDFLTHDSIFIQLKNPGNHFFRYKAGQYVVLTAEIDNQSISRCYSICLDPDLGKLGIGVKRVSNGKMSNYLYENAAVGMKLMVSGPFGDFSLTENNKDSITFIAGGSGITPILPMISKSLNHGAKQVKLLYGCRSENDVIFHSEIENLKAEFPDQFDFNLTYFLLDDEHQLELLAEIDSGHFYICGPEPMMKSSERVLTKKEIPITNIKMEEFVVPDKELIGQQFGITVGNKKFEAYESETILEAAKRNNIDIPYACEKGQCGTCKSTLVTGEITYNGVNNSAILKNEELSGQILCCVSKPKSDLIIKT